MMQDAVSQLLSHPWRDFRTWFQDDVASKCEQDIGSDSDKDAGMSESDLDFSEGAQRLLSSTEGCEQDSDTGLSQACIQEAQEPSLPASSARLLDLLEEKPLFSRTHSRTKQKGLIYSSLQDCKQAPLTVDDTHLPKAAVTAGAEEALEAEFLQEELARDSMFTRLGKPGLPGLRARLGELFESRLLSLKDFTPSGLRPSLRLRPASGLTSLNLDLSNKWLKEGSSGAVADSTLFEEDIEVSLEAMRMEEALDEAPAAAFDDAAIAVLGSSLHRDFDKTCDLEEDYEDEELVPACQSAERIDQRDRSVAVTTLTPVTTSYELVNKKRTRADSSPDPALYSFGLPALPVLQETDFGLQFLSDCPAAERKNDGPAYSAVLPKSCIESCVIAGTVHRKDEMDTSREAGEPTQRTHVLNTVIDDGRRKSLTSTLQHTNTFDQLLSGSSSTGNSQELNQLATAGDIAHAAKRAKFRPGDAMSAVEETSPLEKRLESQGTMLPNSEPPLWSGSATTHAYGAPQRLFDEASQAAADTVTRKLHHYLATVHFLQNDQVRQCLEADCNVDLIEMDHGLGNVDNGADHFDCDLLLDSKAAVIFIKLALLPAAMADTTVVGAERCGTDLHIRSALSSPSIDQALVVLEAYSASGLIVDITEPLMQAKGKLEAWAQSIQKDVRVLLARSPLEAARACRSYADALEAAAPLMSVSTNESRYQSSIQRDQLWQSREQWLPQVNEVERISLQREYGLNAL